MVDQHIHLQARRAPANDEDDFKIFSREGDSGFAVMAPHGGGIEPGTSEIADAIAGHRHAFYTFKGIKPRGNADLHVTSCCFGERTGVMIAAKAATIVTIHGCQGSETCVYVGGRHANLKKRLITRLTAAGFRATNSLRPGLRGVHPDNLCNRGRSGAGVQLELTRGLRETLFTGLEGRSPLTKTDRFHQFVDAVQNAFAALR